MMKEFSKNTLSFSTTFNGEDIITDSVNIDDQASKLIVRAIFENRKDENWINPDGYRIHVRSHDDRKWILEVGTAATGDVLGQNNTVLLEAILSKELSTLVKTLFVKEK